MMKSLGEWRLTKLHALKSFAAIFVFSFSFFVLRCTAQVAPIDAPLIVSGSFGEPRDNHFHTGIDITTRGKTGLKIFAFNDGYVSRIKVSSVGYGKALYVNHPNGTMTVYAHLSKFNDAIQDYVTKAQYAQQKFEVELYPPKEKFAFKKGDVIAYSGNTGGSTAPHLHFEVRDASGESYPENPLAHGLTIKDTIPPLIRSIVLYDRSGTVEQTTKEIPLVRKGNRYSATGTAKADTFNVTTPLPAFGVRAEDYANGVDPDGDFGIYALTLSVDGKEISGFKMDRLDFAHGRYANALVDYKKRKSEKKRVYRAYKLPGNQSSVYTSANALALNDSLVHEISVVTKDHHGNAARYVFYVRNVSGKTVKTKPAAGDNFVQHDQPYNVGSDNIRIVFESGTFYDNAFFNWKKTAARGAAVTSTYQLGENTIPLHKNYTLQLKPEAVVKESLRGKCVIMRGSTAYTTEWRDGWLVAKPKEFGTFRAVIDTTSPRLVPVNFKNNGVAPKSNLKLTITDAQSGVKDYDIYIDGAWTLAEYDAKNDLLTVVPTQKLSAGVHEIKALVTDKVGNKKTYTYKLTF